ncbi:septal ring lytic transglycosylase RlpA family protein [Catenovulum adriaticum]|uniref:Endolytic peptidoglycan transglycosylase RlpA n=1 Tax=Catenovulum adriaticum TaxID=2984846 RepID=A0ABY7APV8_9ALTE|nr:septal ring lytic transglycosylase RlpA family protein [Catenovulum sp. TS8]WAJ71585.1 septal ring lytic transglycosylase RlpA family protein [Catenovulum sp. TS8]
MKLVKPVLIFVYFGMLAACSTVPMQSKSDAVGYTESGGASYYAAKYHGRQTASGETFNQNHLMAAHKILPFGSRVKVTNLANNQSVTVKINDRGPFVSGRVIDLSRAAFSKIANLNQGVVQVTIQVVD